MRNGADVKVFADGMTCCRAMRCKLVLQGSCKTILQMDDFFHPKEFMFPGHGQGTALLKSAFLLFPDLEPLVQGLPGKTEE